MRQGRPVGAPHLEEPHVFVPNRGQAVGGGDVDAEEALGELGGVLAVGGWVGARVRIGLGVGGFGGLRFGGWGVWGA